MVVAQAAGDRRASRQILFDERLHDLALESVFMIDHVIRDAESLGDTARVVDIVERAAAALHCFRHAFVPSQTALVPQLHGQADDVVSLGAKHGRDGRRVDSARHGYGDGFRGQHLAVSN